MSLAATSKFESLQVKAQCCGATVSLQDLRYGWPIAFASYVLEAANPHTEGLGAQQLAQVASTLGCSIVEIKAHF